MVFGELGGLRDGGGGEVKADQDGSAVRVLLAAGANAAIQDASGKRAVDYAEDNTALRVSDVYWLLNDASFQ